MMALVLKGGIAAVVLGALLLAGGLWLGIQAGRAVADSGQAAPAPDAQVADSPVSTPQPGKPRPAFTGLQQSVVSLLQAAGVSGGVTVAELGGPSPQTWAYDGDQQYVAASTYKLPLLMMDAQNVSAGRWHANDSLCYQDGDWEDGWYGDYTDGVCMPRSQLEQRIGHDSDNTAAHILVRYAGGTGSLNAYAHSHGTRESEFYDPNTTTTNDLARLLVDEAAGRAGGQAAQRYLYPLLTHTSYEDGIPAGVPARASVVHKIGALDSVVNDAALVRAGPRGPYVLAICTQGAGGDAGWKLVADISRAVWQFEASR
jgi:beta-lactamase class A